MCGRMANMLPPQAMAQLFGAVPANDLPETPNFNVCPTTQIHVVSATDQRRLISMRWGFLPHWYKAPNDGPLLINARAETIAEKPAFRAACRERRCLIPTSGFYEWTKDADGNRLPWYVTPRDGAPMVMAGIWQAWGQGEEQINTCAIVTTQATGEMAEIHHRVPVMVAPDQFGLWLGEEGKGAATLLQSPSEGYLQMHRVGTTVNSNRASGPELIEPWDASAE